MKNLKRSTLHYLAGHVCTSLDHIYLISSIECMDNILHLNNIMFSYDMFEYNEQLN